MVDSRLPGGMRGIDSKPMPSCSTSVDCMEPKKRWCLAWRSCPYQLIGDSSRILFLSAMTLELTENFVNFCW